MRSLSLLLALLLASFPVQAQVSPGNGGGALPTGAATSANQNSTAAGTSATNAQGVQGVTGGVPLPIVASNSTSVTGSLTAAGQTVVFVNTGGYGTVGFDISGTWVGVLIVESQATPTGAWYTTTVTPFDAAAVSGFAANAAGQANISGLYALRIRAVTLSSGSASISLQAGQSASAVTLAVPPGLPLPVNTSQVAGTTTATGNGVTGAGTQRVTLSSDSTGVVTGLLSGAVANPTSTLTMTSATTAYAANQLIATSATGTSIVVPSFAIATSAGGAAIPRLRLSTNDTTSTAWGGVSLQVDLWTAAPTFASGSGDRSTFTPTTGTGSHIGSYSCTVSAEYGDGAYAECAPNVGNFALPKLASGTAIYWTLQALSASGVTGASKVWALTAETLN